ncbi:MAG: recombinase RecT [Dehalococcoidia bacterium]|jgi:recombination protein RecT
MEQYEVAVYDKKIKERFLEVVDEPTYNREVAFAIQAIRANETLQKCDPQTIKNAVVNIALTGATLNPVLQQAALVPRKGKCCLDIMYRGLVHIAVDSDSVYDIDAVPVFEGEEFYYEMGLNPVLIHKPKLYDEKKPEIVAVYAIAVLHHGIKKFVVLDREKIARARKSSQTATVWNAHPDEMAKKTAVKLLYKLLPQTERMSTAVSVLNEHEGLMLKDERKAKEVMKRFAAAADDDNIEMISCPNKEMEMVAKETCKGCHEEKTCPELKRSNEKAA